MHIIDVLHSFEEYNAARPLNSTFRIWKCSKSSVEERVRDIVYKVQYIIRSNFRILANEYCQLKYFIFLSRYLAQFDSELLRSKSAPPSITSLVLLISSRAARKAACASRWTRS